MSRAVVVTDGDSLFDDCAAGRILWNEGKQNLHRGTVKLLLFGFELCRLKEKWGDKRGGDRKSDGFKNQTGNNYPFDSQTWEALVNEQFGISRKTADIYMHACRPFGRILNLGTKYDMTPEMRKIKEEELSKLIGNMPFGTVQKVVTNEQDATSLMLLSDKAANGDEYAQEQMQAFWGGKLDSKNANRAAGGAKATKGKPRPEIDPRRSAVQSGTNFVKLIDTWAAHDAGTQKEIRKQVGKLLDALQAQPDAVPRSHRPDSENLADAQKIAQRSQS